MRRLVFPFLLAVVMLSCLGIFLSLPATSASGVPSALARANMGHMDRGTNVPAPVRDRSYPQTPAEEIQETDNRPISARLLTMPVLVIVSFRTSVLWMLTTKALRQGAICSSDVVRASLSKAREEPSFLAAFLL